MTTTTIHETEFEKIVQTTITVRDFVSTSTTRYKKEFHVSFPEGFRWISF